MTDGIFWAVVTRLDDLLAVIGLFTVLKNVVKLTGKFYNWKHR